MKSGFFWIFPFFAKNVLLIKVYFLYNRYVNFRAPSKKNLPKIKLDPIFRDILLVWTCRNVKSAILTTPAARMILGIKIIQNWSKIEFLWLKLSYASLVLIKFSKFISKKVVSEARFLCSGASRRLKYVFYY